MIFVGGQWRQSERNPGFPESWDKKVSALGISSGGFPLDDLA